MSQDLISVIIPVYNGEKSLTNCFKVLSKQDYANLEIIFIDNNSTDQSYNIINEHCTDKSNYKLYKCQKKGPAAARNMGIKHSSGDYLSFLDVDDSISPKKYSILSEVAKKFPKYKIIFGIGRKMDNNDHYVNIDYGDIVPGENKAPTHGILWLSQFQHQVHPGAILVHHSAVKEIRGFPEELFYGEDIAFMVKLGLKYDSFFVEKIVYTNKQNDLSITSIADKNLTINERFYHFYKYFAIEYFYKRKNNKLYKLCFEIIEFSSFKSLIRLIKYEKKYKYINDLNWQLKFTDNSFLKYFRLVIFTYFPLKIANYIYYHIHRINKTLLKI